MTFDSKQKSRRKRYPACGDVVHRGDPNPNQVSNLHGVSARREGMTLSPDLSEADLRQP